MTTSTTPKNEERSAYDRLKAIERAHAAKAQTNASRRADVIRDELSRPRAKDCRCPITPHSTHEAVARIGCQVHRRPMGLPDPRRNPPEARRMTTTTLANAPGQSTQIQSGRHQRPDVCDAYRALWAMTRDERIAAMWRGDLSLRQLCQWSSRAQPEVPLLGGEFAWIVMSTPDWGRSQQPSRRTTRPRRPPRGRPMTIALTTVGSRSVTLTIGPSALEEAPDGVALKLTLHDGPLVLTLTRDEAQALNAELTEELAETRKAP
jgi:hypothetical protein